MISRLLLGKPPAYDNDEHAGSVVLHTHFNWEGSESKVIDVTGKPLNIINDGRITTSVSKFGNGCYESRSASSSCETPDHPSLRLTGDLTIEGWYNLSTLAPNSGLFSKSHGANYSFLQLYAGILYFYNGATNVGIFSKSANSELPLYVWNHVALTRFGNLWSIYINGKIFGSVTANFIFGNTAVSFQIGNMMGGGYGIRGYVDEFRVTNGVCRYSSNFTVPTDPFADAI